jgi:hypothetical protein
MFAQEKKCTRNDDNGSWTQTLSVEGKRRTSTAIAFCANKKNNNTKTLKSVFDAKAFHG